MSSWLDIVNNPALQEINGRIEVGSPETSESKNSYTLIDSQTILAVTGEDAVKFLQGQCTADLHSLEVGHSTFGAICTNKGRVICNFRALKTEDSVLLRMSADIAQETLDKIKKYAAFFKVEMSVWEIPSVAVLFQTGATNAIPPLDLPKGVYCISDDKIEEFYATPGSAESLLDLLKSQGNPRSESDWYAAQIQAGLVNINICTTEKYLPHQLNLDRSGAISFTKGCYTGQEIVARTEYRGTSKRRIRPVKLFTDIKDPHQIQLQTQGENPRDIREIDVLMSAKTANNEILVSALLPTDQPAKGAFSVNGVDVDYEILALPYSLEDEAD